MDDVCGEVLSDLDDGDLAALGQRAAVSTELMDNGQHEWWVSDGSGDTCLMGSSDDVVVFDALNTELDAQSEALDVRVLGMT